jgi:hypothetical protein
MSYLRHWNDRQQRWLTALVCLLLVSAQLFLIVHNFGGQAHPLGDPCQVCALHYSSSHAAPPTLPAPPVIRPNYAPVLVLVSTIVTARRVTTTQPRAPPLV